MRKSGFDILWVDAVKQMKTLKLLVTVHFIVSRFPWLPREGASLDRLLHLCIASVLARDSHALLFLAGNGPRLRSLRSLHREL